MYSDTEQLWKEYHAKMTPKLREQLVLKYAPLVKKTVGRMGLRPDGPIEWEDLINYGIIGLIDAIERFDPDRGASFATFATVRIRGAVLDALRQFDPLGRLARRRVKAAKEAIHQLTVELGRLPTDSEVASKIGLTEHQYKQVLQDASFTILSLEQPFQTGEDQTSKLAEIIEDPDAVNSLESIEEAELRERLMDAITTLPQREQVLLSLYYYEDLTMREVATAMGISQTRVCQLHARAILTLRALMDAHTMKEAEEAEPIDFSADTTDVGPSTPRAEDPPDTYAEDLSGANKAFRRQAHIGTRASNL